MPFVSDVQYRIVQRHLQARGIHHWRMRDWLAHACGEQVAIGNLVYRNGVSVQGLNMYDSQRNLLGFYLPRQRYLVLSKRAPKWVRNWARREHYNVVELWAPLTAKNVRESVKFDQAVRAAERVAVALAAPMEEELPF